MAGKINAKKRVTKGRAKRWKKGHSSDSNPEAKKHRLAAKTRFFNTDRGDSGLTVDALAKHDNKDGDTEMASEGASDTQSFAGKTFNTWATNWTECTNTTFSKVHRYWQSNSALHKEVLAVLAAVTEVIKQQGGQETETEYFAALMTTLRSVEGDQSVTAVTYLLSLAMKRVPQVVLKAKFSEVSKLILDTLAQHAATDSPALLRSLLSCLASLLRIQEKAAWANASTTQVYHGLLAFITHSKPKVRKAAHEAVRVVLKTSVFLLSDSAPTHHPAAVTTATYCIKQIEESGGGEQSTGTLHTLELLRHILHTFPPSSLKSTVETLLKVMTLSNVLVTSVAMRCLHSLFQAQPSAATLSAELNAQLISALYDYQPGLNDPQPLTAWLVVMETAHVNLARLDSKLAISHLPRLFATCMTCMRSEKTDVTKSAATSLKELIVKCLSPNVEFLGAMVNKSTSGGQTAMHKMFASLESGLSYQFHAAWGMVLQVLASCFQALGKHCHMIMKKCLVSLADLRDSHQFPHKGDLDYAVGMAIRTMGPKQVLETIPLRITGENDDLSFPRSWLLPVLRDHVRDTELEFFISYFLPLAAKLRAKSVEHAAAQHVVEAQTYDTLQYQIWLLLPAFCTGTTDVAQCFKGIARILGSALTDRPDIRSEVMASLRRLVIQNIDQSENRTELSRFSKNFLPILFNLFTTAPEDEKDTSRLAVLETIKSYMQITDPQLIGTFFDKCSSKLDESDLSSFKRHSLLDLMIVKVPYLDKGRLVKLSGHAAEHLESTDRTVQKKCYRLLEELCSCQSEAGASFLRAALPSLQQTLLSSLGGSAPSSKAPRLRCLHHIVERLEEPEMAFISAVVPEAILCTKEVAEKARSSALSLLATMGDAILRWHPEQDKAQTLNCYFELVLAGLAGSPHMIACTTLALTRLLYHFKDSISDELLAILVDNTCLLLQAKPREVVLSALGLVKVILSLRSDADLAQYLKQLVASLVSMKEDNRHHFRFKTKDIFTRLIRKFGFETVYTLVPFNLKKMLDNIRKTQERVKRKKASAESEEDEDEEEDTLRGKNKPESFEELLPDTDSELEEEDEGRKKKKKKLVGSEVKKAGAAAWLREGMEEDIIDFMDPGVARNILATKPDAQKGDKGDKKKSDSYGFKMAPDGRFIISEEPEESRNKKKEAPVIDDVEELLEALGGPKKASRKRKAAESLAVDDDEDTTMKYRAGGSGIHRPVAASASAKRREHGSEYRSKKADGDMKKKGRPDPFAYVPLEMTALNKRKRSKVKGQFQNLIKGAKKGAAKGGKRKKTKH